MDEQRFDQITKRLGTARTRRATLKGLGVALLGAAGLATGLEAEAKRKGKRHGTSARVQITCLGNPCNTDHPCCAGFDCSDSAGGTCQCHLGACQHNTDCTCTDVTTCGTFGDTNGQCCRTRLGVYCNAPTETGSGCCGPAYVCASPGVFPPPANGGCQCNTAAGFVNNNGVCECPAGQHVNDAGQCVADTTCIPVGGNCNINHPCCHPDQFHCSSSTTTTGTCVANETCVAVGGNCNACHPCCDGSTCTKPDAPCTGPADAGVCVANQDCVPVGGNCNINHPCCHPDQFHCSSSTTETGTCVANTNCTGGQVPCGDQCINPDTQCCADEELGVLCPPDPRGQRKCCPAGHTCNPNHNGTYNCGKGHGVRGRQGRGRNSR